MMAAPFCRMDHGSDCLRDILRLGGIYGSAWTEAGVLSGATDRSVAVVGVACVADVDVFGRV
jgi:hypothetical protein